MESTAVTALATALGSLVGALSSIATTWITQHSQTIRTHIDWKLRERESLYKEFISEASRLTADALIHSLQEPEKFVGLYALLSRIRLVSSEPVLAKAEECCHRIADFYRQPNLTGDQIHEAFQANHLDLLKDFSYACRSELMRIAKR